MSENRKAATTDMKESTGKLKTNLVRSKVGRRPRSPLSYGVQSRWKLYGWKDLMARLLMPAGGQT